MSDFESRYARLLTEWSLAVKPGQVVLIDSSYLAEPLIRQLVPAILRAGGHPDLSISIDGYERAKYEHASDEQLRFISPREKKAIETYDAIIYIRAPFNLRELESIPTSKKSLAVTARGPLKKVFMRRTADGSLTRTLCEYPTSARAQSAGMGLEEYRNFVAHACFLDEPDPVSCWQELHERQQEIVDMLNSCDIINYRGNDIDVTFSTKGRTWINSDGRTNMPSGEVFTSPVENTVNGKIRFSYPGIYMGQEISDITLEIRDGEVVTM
jgi:aminopeptidase